MTTSPKSDTKHPFKNHQPQDHHPPFVDTLLQVHTNGVTNTAVRGLRLIYQPGRVEDEKLAESALCYMKELIHATPSYESYPVGGVYTDDNAETREADMSTVIAEVGFHTNPEDQVALKDPAFQRAAMLGFEKGYRMYRLGKSCEPFTITSTPTIKAASTSSFQIVSHYQGNPTFPVQYGEPAKRLAAPQVSRVPAAREHSLRQMLRTHS